MKNTNKGRRIELAKLKEKKRIKNILGGDEVFRPKKTHVYRSTGKPCSCYICSGLKYKRGIKHRKQNEE